MFDEKNIAAIVDQYTNFLTKNIDKSKLNSKQHKISNLIYYNDLNAIKQRIQNWLSARIAARYAFSPNWTDLIRVYDYVKIDSHVFGVMNGVKQKIKSKDFVLLDSKGESNKDLTKLLKSSWFSRYLDYAIEALFYPYSLIELGEYVKGFRNLKLIKREYVIPQWESVKMFLYGTAVPSYAGIRNQPGVQFSDMTDILKDPSSYLIEYIKSPERIDDYILIECPLHDLGLFDLAAPHAIGKMNSFSYFLDYLQKFVIPFRHGKTDINDPLRRNNMDNLMRDWGGSGAAVTDLMDEINILEQSGTTIAPFTELFKYSNNEISKAFLSAVGVTDEKSFVGSAEAGERMADIIVQSYCRDLEFNINDEFLPRLSLRDRRYIGTSFEFVYKENIPYKIRVDSVVKLADKFDLDVNEVSDMLDMDISKKEVQDVNKDTNKIFKKKEEEDDDDINKGIDNFSDYPVSVIRTVKRALDFNNIMSDKKDYKNNIKWVIANKIINNECLDIIDVKNIAKIHKFEKKKDTPYMEGNEGLTWDAYGGNKMIQWAIEKLKNNG